MQKILIVSCGGGKLRFGERKAHRQRAGVQCRMTSIHDLQYALQCERSKRPVLYVTVHRLWSWQSQYCVFIAFS